MIELTVQNSHCWNIEM